MTTGPRQVALRFDAVAIDRKWQERWSRDGLYRVNDEDSGPKWYELTMYPYPSGDLHIGHWYAMAPADCHARFRRMQGYNVLHPIGFDAFGLPAENAAISRGIHPFTWTMSNIDNMRRQLRSMGAVYDWDREVNTCTPEYYRWNQWYFLKFLERGLAYRSEAPVVWCPSCQTVLANEQVVNGACERCNTEITRRNLEQWFFRITDYAERLLDFSGLVDWPDKILTMQTNWIGRSEGVEIGFDIAQPDLEQEEIRTFTTRIDTIFGVTFLVLAPEHPLVAKLITEDRRADVDAYIDRARQTSEIDRMSTETEKTGVFLGSYAVNRLNGERVPVFIADYVLMTYGTGAVMGVPAHDARDFDFAAKYKLPVRIVVAPLSWDGSDLAEAYLDEGFMTNSGPYEGLTNLEGKEAIADDLERNGWGAARRVLPDARLAHIPPALLGHAHTRCLLRPVRYGARARRGPAGAASFRCRVQTHRRITPGFQRGLCKHFVSPLRRSGPARDRHHGHLHGLVLVYDALPLAGLRPRARGARSGQAVAACGPVHRGRRARGNALALFQVLHQGAL